MRWRWPRRRRSKWVGTPPPPPRAAGRWAYWSGAPRGPPPARVGCSPGSPSQPITGPSERFTSEEVRVFLEQSEVEYRPQRREVSVAAVPIQPVAEQELVPALDSAIRQIDVDDATGDLVEQGRGGEGGRVPRLQQAEEIRERQTGVDDVLAHDPVASGARG